MASNYGQTSANRRRESAVRRTVRSGNQLLLKGSSGLIAKANDGAKLFVENERLNRELVDMKKELDALDKVNKQLLYEQVQLKREIEALGYSLAEANNTIRELQNE